MITEPIKFTKRIGHLFERVVDLDNIKLAIRNAAKRKSDRPSVRRILLNVDKYAKKLQEILITESWVPHAYQIREINDGIKKKKRIIAVPRFFPDQCIHHAFVLVFKEVVEHGSYEHSCGCVPGKGTDGARKVIKRWVVNDPKGTSKVAVLDVKQCYPTLPHEQLRLKLEKRIKDRKFLRLAFKIIASYQQAMANKTQLLPETIAVGIPVGLYTSPWFLNFFFQDLDHLIAEKCGLSHLVRYVDDMVLFDNSKKRLHAAIRTVGDYLQHMQMRLKSTWQVYHLRIRPLDFLGFKFHANGKITLRKSILYRISRKARTIARKGYASVTNASGMISYKGYMDHSDSTGFYEKWVQPFINFKVLKGVVSNENRKQCKAICAA